MGDIEKILLRRRFFISWLLSTIVMFGVSYLWHGTVLNDFERLNYPEPIFFSCAAVAYLIIGLALNKAHEKFKKYVYDKSTLESFKSKPILKGMITGAMCGFSVYIIALVVGISFNYNLSLQNILLDLSWQITEQTIGGLVVGVMYRIFYIPPHLMMEQKIEEIEFKNF